MSDTEKLKHIPLFHNFSGAMLEEFASTFKPSAYAPGDVIFKEKADGNSLFIIVSGEVVIEKAMDEVGREFKTLATLAGGDFFGEVALIDGAARFAPAPASARRPRRHRALRSGPQPVLLLHKRAPRDRDRHHQRDHAHRIPAPAAHLERAYHAVRPQPDAAGPA